MKLYFYRLCNDKYCLINRKCKYYFSKKFKNKIKIDENRNILFKYLGDKLFMKKNINKKKYNSIIDIKLFAIYLIKKYFSLVRLA